MTGIFRNRYPNLQGCAWVRGLSPEDRAFFVDLGNQANDHGRLGGKARAASACRVHGKFVRADGTFQPYHPKGNLYTEGELS